MSEYRVTTEVVRASYVKRIDRFDDLSGLTSFYAQKDFDRWLAHIQAEAWDGGHGHCFRVEDPNNPIKGNPYREEPNV